MPRRLSACLWGSLAPVEDLPEVGRDDARGGQVAAGLPGPHGRVRGAVEDAGQRCRDAAGDHRALDAPDVLAARAALLPPVATAGEQALPVAGTPLRRRPEAVVDEPVVDGGGEPATEVLRLQVEAGHALLAEEA